MLLPKSRDHLAAFGWSLHPAMCFPKSGFSSREEMGASRLSRISRAEINVLEKHFDLSILSAFASFWPNTINCHVVRLQAMHSARIAYCAALLLLLAVTSADSAKCSRLIDGVTKPRSIAEGKYHFFMTLFNRTEIVNEYMPNTRYNGKYSVFGREN